MLTLVRVLGLMFLMVAAMNTALFAQTNWKFFNSTGVAYHRGIGHYTTLYFNGGEFDVKNDEQILGFSSVNGFKNHWYGLGLGLGIDKWQSATLFPVYVSYHVTLTNKTVAPTLFLNIGYSFGGKQKTFYSSAGKGNFMLQPAFGAVAKLSPAVKLTLGVSYKIQGIDSRYKRIIFSSGGDHEMKYNIFYHFIGVHAGVMF